MPEARKTDYGSTITLTLYEGTTAVDISAATTKSFVIKKPDATTSTKTAAFVTDGTDGALVWTITTGFLDQTGPYEIMAAVTDSSTFLYNSRIATFFVESILS